MKEKKGLIILILVTALLIGSAAVLYDRLSAENAPDQIVAENDPGHVENDTEGEAQELTPAPDFTVYTADGAEVKLSDMKGKPVILNFWASWCSPCKMEMPDFDEVYAQHGEDIHFMMVNLTDGSRETVEKASAYIEEQGYSFPVYYDTTQEAAYTYAVSAIPTTYFIDAEGHFVAYGQGALSMEHLLTGLGMITE